MRSLLRRLARWYLLRSWRAMLPPAERARFDYWGATGNANHSPYEWAEE